MTGETEQKRKKPAAKKGKAKKPKVKHVRQMGVLSILFLVIFIIILVTFTPIYSVVLGFLPEQYKHTLFKNIHQTIILDETGKKLSEPFKHTPSASLPVLGYNTGLCFSFSYGAQKGENSSMNQRAISQGERGEVIAEIIAIGNNKYEYSLKTTIVEQVTDSDNNEVTNICQIFGRDYPVTPKTINVIYIRPLKHFAPNKILWATTRDIRQN